MGFLLHGKEILVNTFILAEKEKMTTEENLENKLYGIVPLVKLPVHLEGEFTYLSRLELMTGDLVKIPFRNRPSLGIVARRLEKNGLGIPSQPHLKEVAELVEKSHLFSWQIDLAKEAAVHYLTPAAMFIKAMCPKRVLQRNPVPCRGKAQGRFTIKQREAELSREVIKKLNLDKKILLFYKDRINIYLYLLSYFIKKGKRVLFLVPEQSLLSAYDELFGRVFGENEVADLGKDASQGSFYSTWQNIRRGKQKIILGTRSAVFAPFPDLDLIIIDEAHDTSHKQWDLNPRYDTRFMAELIQKQLTCQILWGSYCPSVQDYYEFSRKDAVIPKDATLDEARDIEEHVYIIDAEERGNYASSKIFTEPAIEAIARLIDKQKTVFLATSQKGSFGCYYCADCGHIFKCSCCNRSYYATDDALKCPDCHRKIPLPSSCPVCHNRVVKAVGLGIGKLYEEAKKIFPKNQALLIADQTGTKRDKKLERLAIFLKGGIVVGSMNFMRLARFNPHAGGCFLINADKSLFLPDFTAAERRYQEIAQLATEKYDNYVQTKFMESLILTEALAGKYQSFYLRELAARRRDHLPPFRKIILFTSRDTLQENALLALGELRQVIIGAIEEKHVGEFIVSDIYPGFPEKIRNKYRFHLSLSFKKKVRRHIDLAQIRMVAGKHNVVIDVDPVSLA